MNDEEAPGRALSPASADGAPPRPPRRTGVFLDPDDLREHVGVFSVTNLDLDLSPDLASFLLTTNHKLGFGAFSYDPDNRAVWLRHTLLGSTLDLPELQSAVASVATTAAALDETIRDRFGGRTFQEAPDEVQRSVEPPDATGDARPPNASGYL